MSALGINVGSFVEEDLDNVEVAMYYSGLEGIAVFSALGINVGSFVEEDLDNV